MVEGTVRPSTAYSHHEPPPQVKEPAYGDSAEIAWLPQHEKNTGVAAGINSAGTNAYLARVYLRYFLGELSNRNYRHA